MGNDSVSIYAYTAVRPLVLVECDLLHSTLYSQRPKTAVHARTRALSVLLRWAGGGAVRNIPHGKAIVGVEHNM